MPELPEVETVVRDLRPRLVGRRLRAARRGTDRALRQPWRDEWAGMVAGREVTAVRRRGKWIVLDLDDGAAVVVHLGMTGQLTVVPAEAELAGHTHLIFDLAPDAAELRFRDPRRFGRVTWHGGPAGVEELFRETGLGPEPFDLDPAGWRAALSATGRAVKAVLLDQGVVAGVGNIYADEALFEARLHPARRGRDLSPAEAGRLRKAVAAVLRRAIDRRGSTIRDYVGGDGAAGGYQDELRAYGRAGQPCPRCGEGIAVLRLAGRSSHHCPSCQPAP